MKRLVLALLVSLILLVGCAAPASVPPTATGDSASQADSRIMKLEKELKAKEEAIAKLQQQMQEQQRRLDALTPPPPPPAPPAPARFVLGELTITPTTVKTGEVVTISIEVSNTGGIEGSYTVVFQVERLGKATAVKNIEVTLKAGQTKTVTFTTTVEVPPQDIILNYLRATYQVNVNGKVGQFTVTAPPPTPPAPPAPPTPEELKAKQIIKDLAYIKASIMPYSDDADPQYEGLRVSVSYYDSKSKLVTFSDVPVNVTIELQMYAKPFYRKQVVMNSSGTFFGEVLRIPFGELPTAGDPNVILVVVVSTPAQGDFSYRGVTPFFWW